GLLESGRTRWSDRQCRYAQSAEIVGTFTRTLENHQIGLSDVIHKIAGTILVGLSTLPGAFSEPIVREMASKCERPIILPLSNPTSKSEAVPENLLRWTEGRALIAAGSPFASVDFHGQKMQIAQCNNVYIFPAVGLAICAARAKRVS